MSRVILFCLTVVIIESTSAQFRTSDIQPQTIPELRNQNLQKLRTIGPVSSLTSPRMKFVSHRNRYVIKKSPQKKITKRQLLAELFKQSAVKNLQDLQDYNSQASSCGREEKLAHLSQFLGNIPARANGVASRNSDRSHLKYV